MVSRCCLLLTLHVMRAILPSMAETVKGSIPSEALRPPPEYAVQQGMSLGRFRQVIHSLVAGVALAFVPAVPADDNASGPLFIAGGGLSEKLEGDFVKLAGGKKAKIVVIPTASERADLPEEEYPLARVLKPPEGQQPLFIRRMHTRNPREADTEAFVKILDDATGVWFGGGNQSFIIDAYQGTRVVDAIHKLRERGGVVGGTSAGAAVMGKRMIRRGNPPEMGDGLGLLPMEAIVDQHFNGKDYKAGRRKRLQIALEEHPELLGIGIDEKTAIVVRQNIAKVIGESTVEFFTLPSEGRKSYKLRSGDTFDLHTGTPQYAEQTSDVLDITAGMP